MSYIKLENLDKIFSNGRHPVKEFSLEIPHGALVSLVGPATCGKSVVVSMIAGLETPTNGIIYFDGEQVNHMSPREREVAVVSKEHTLYTELSVYDNIAMSLKLKKLNPETTKQIVDEVLALLDITEIKGVLAKDLGPLQVQKVSIARFAVRKPKIILMDEPFQDLDKNIHDQLLRDLASINQKLGITMLYATGSPADAKKLGGTIGIMHRGVLQQYGTYEELKNDPQTVFVAGFVGDVLTNYIEVKLEADEKGIRGRLVNQLIRIPDNVAQKYGLHTQVGETCQIGVRADHITFSRKPSPNCLVGRVFAKESHDGCIIWTAKTDDVHIMSTDFDVEIRLNEEVYLSLSLDQATVLFR